MTQLSEHFSFEELTGSNGHPNLVSQNQIEAKAFIGNLTLAANAAEQVRTLANGPIGISSGFRNKALNSAVGGAATSKHMQGLCVDLHPTLITIDELFNTLLSHKGSLTKLRKVIIEGIKGKFWIHIQARVPNDGPLEFYSTTDGRNYTKVA
ncbi:MAG: hypothetical protein JHC33_09620 [Ignisphaera sp.]|nr:hypothetical protein [Ignisphaera sp.]